jgi:hypothetical protein
MVLRWQMPIRGTTDGADATTEGVDSGSLCFTPWEDLLQVDEIQKTKRAIPPVRRASVTHPQSLSFHDWLT